MDRFKNNVIKNINILLINKVIEVTLYVKV